MTHQKVILSSGSASSSTMLRKPISWQRYWRKLRDYNEKYGQRNAFESPSEPIDKAYSSQRYYELGKPATLDLWMWLWMSMTHFLESCFSSSTWEHPGGLVKTDCRAPPLEFLIQQVRGWGWSLRLPNKFPDTSVVQDQTLRTIVLRAQNLPKSTGMKIETGEGIERQAEKVF